MSKGVGDSFIPKPAFTVPRESFMKKVLHILNNLEEYLLAVFLPLMCIIVFVNTVGRYTGTLSIPWAEEAARYLMIWLVFIGIAAAAKKNSHFAVEVFFLITPKVIHKFGRCFILLMVVFFNLTVAGLALNFVKRLHGMEQVSPSLGIPMWLMYSAIPIGCFLMAVRSIQYFVKNYKAAWDPEAAALESAGACDSGLEEEKE